MTAARTVFLKVGELIPGTQHDSMGPCVISIEDGIISAVDPLRDWEASGPPDAAGVEDTVVDCSGLTALPGFIDSHVHLASISVADLYPNLNETEFMTTFGMRIPLPEVTDGRRLLSGIRSAHKLLKTGVTTARDCGAPRDVALWLRDGIEAGLINGPRLLVSGPIITMTGGHGHYMAVEADGVEEVRKATRLLVKKGVDFIKITATGGLGTPATNPGRAGYSVLEMQAIVEEAHNLGVHVAAHILASEGTKRCLEAGVDTFEHNWFIEPDGRTRFDEELVKRMVDENVVCSPTPATATLRLRKIQHKIDAGTASDREVVTASWCRQRLRENGEIVARMHDMGVRMINGTDGSGGIIAIDEYPASLELMVQGGMSPLDAIVASTSQPASVLGINSGALEVGRLADITLVEGNPLEDISDAWHVRRVYKEGTLVYSSSAPDLMGESGALVDSRRTGGLRNPDHVDWVQRGTGNAV